MRGYSYLFNIDFSRRTRSVTIHVCDGSRNEKKDFVCNQELLLTQMGYFR